MLKMLVIIVGYVLAICNVIFVFLQQHHDYGVQFFGAATGAFFAFCFFLSGDWMRRKIDRRKNIVQEHATLERYLANIHTSISYNKLVVEQLIDDYSSKKITLMGFRSFPIREEASMKISDQIFINKLEFFNADLVSVNFQLSDLEQLKERIDVGLVSTEPILRKVANDSLSNYMESASKMITQLNFLTEESIDLIIENQVILKTYKNWRFNKRQVEKKLSKRKKEIETERIIVEDGRINNPIFQDRLEKLKKYGMINE